MRRKRRVPFSDGYPFAFREEAVPAASGRVQYARGEGGVNHIAIPVPVTAAESNLDRYRTTSATPAWAGIMQDGNPAILAL